MDAHTTEFVFFWWCADDVCVCVTFGVGFVVVFVNGVYDVLEMFFPCGFAFVYGELGDGVWEVEEWGRWVVVECGVPFFWGVIVPVICGCFYDTVADVGCGFSLMFGGVVVCAGDPCGVVKDYSGVCGFLVSERVFVMR